MNNNIKDFINSHRVLSLATCKNNIPYNSNCFYVFFNELNLFVFTSSSKSRHIKISKEQNEVAGSIINTDEDINNVEGVQFTGKFVELENDIAEKGKELFYKKFPQGIFKSDFPFWGIIIRHATMINIIDGILHKTEWNNPEMDVDFYNILNDKAYA